MLLRFGVSNHRSICDYRELHLSASRRIKRKGPVIPAPTLKENAVPVVALYGSNATGKSNLIDAMDEIRRVIVRSHKSLGATDRIPRTPFRLDGAGNTQPTRFDCTFSVGEGVSAAEQSPPTPESVYEYGFEYVDTEFRREWLYRMVRNERQSTQVLFERRTEDGKVRVRFGSQLRGRNRTIASLTRPNSLFLSAGAQNNHSLLIELYRYFAERWKIILNSEAMDELIVAKRLSDYGHMENLLMLIRQADIGIVDIDIKEEEVEEKRAGFERDLASLISKHFPQNPEHDLEASMVNEMLHRKRLSFMHSAAGDRTAAFRYSTESKGTRTLISLLIPALEALSRGSLLVIDELDTSLHTNLARSFVSLFTKKESNPHGAQLVFSTHDVALLGSGVLNPDEIWLTDKSHEGESQFTPLTDFKLRSRDDIEKAYRAGRFGGIPIGDDFFISFREDGSSAGP